jgi:hypothetical protein
MTKTTRFTPKLSFSLVLPFSLATAFLAAAPTVSHARPVTTLFAMQQEEKPAEHPQDAKPPEHPTDRPQDAKPPDHRTDHPQDAKPPENRPPDHEPDKPAKPPKNQMDNRQAPPAKAQPQNTQADHRNQPKPNVHYSFRSEDKGKLRAHYQAQFGSIDRAHRPHFSSGAYFPNEYVTYIEPVPVDVIGLLPAIPEGYVAGYWDGYCFIYDPSTFYIVAVIDLM